MNTNNYQKHTPVLLSEVINFLNVAPGKRYIDATVGGGGHMSRILELGGQVLGLDQDPQSLQVARENLPQKGTFRLIHSNFSNIDTVARQEGWDEVDGILFDLGFASFQVEDPERGLSFTKDGPLDMRLDPTLGVTAADLVNSLPEKELTRLFQEYGEEPRARQIARTIVENRKVKPFSTTKELADLVKRVSSHKFRIHPATKIFQALRIAVNMELENLKVALPQALNLLGESGRLVIIGFHSGEDRIVKRFFLEKEKSGEARILTKKPATPGKVETETNRRARSAKLRVLEKII